MLLTYMATLEDVVASGILHPFELPTWEKRLPLWPLYVADSLFEGANARRELDDPALARGGRSLRELSFRRFVIFDAPEGLPPAIFEE
jgi:hypothetical protein